MQYVCNTAYLAMANARGKNLPTDGFTMAGYFYRLMFDGTPGVVVQWITH